jgi:hypothetical protein
LQAQRGGGDWAFYSSESVTLSSTPQTVWIVADKPNDGYPIQLVIGDVNTGETVYVKDESLATTNGSATINSNGGVNNGPNLLVDTDKYTSPAWKVSSFLKTTALAGGDVRIEPAAVGGTGTGSYSQTIQVLQDGPVNGQLTMQGSGVVELFIQNDASKEFLKSAYITLNPNTPQTWIVTAPTALANTKLNFGVTGLDSGE